MVGVYEVNEQGKLSALQVYWDWDNLMAHKRSDLVEVQS